MSVAQSNFGLVNTGLGGAPAITNLTGSGSTYTVTASTGSGSGTLGLNLTSVASIQDSAGNALSAGWLGPVIALLVLSSAIGQFGGMSTAVSRLPFAAGVDGLLSPDAIAETYWHLHRQHRSAWTHELDLRPYKESF